MGVRPVRAVQLELARIPAMGKKAVETILSKSVTTNAMKISLVEE
jgi:hypothetical protein